MTTKLNLGCGRDYKDGWENIDISKEVRADHHLDIRTTKLPFGDGEASEVYISGVLEQVGNNEQFIFVMNECNRVLEKGGVMNVVVPNSKYAIAHQDPMDVRKFTVPTFEYFLEGNRHYDLYGSVYGFLPWNRASVTENGRGILEVKMIK